MEPRLDQCWDNVLDGEPSLDRCAVFVLVTYKVWVILFENMSLRPADTIRLINVDLTLVHRLRRWTNMRQRIFYAVIRDGVKYT